MDSLILDQGTYNLIATANKRLDSWIESQDFKGYDPFDALNSPLLKHLTFGNRRVGQAWVQLAKLSPVNFRPLLSIPTGYNPKGMGLFLGSYFRKYLLSKNPDQLERMFFFFDWLQTNATPGYHGICWGYNFDWPNRGFYAPAGTPTIVNTAFIALSFLDLECWKNRFSPLNAQIWHSNTFTPLGLARSACNFILNDLQVAFPAPGERCFSYTPLDKRYVHNANLLGAWLLAEVGALTSERELTEAAFEAARFTAHRQRQDGSWPYGESVYDQWVDNFHTGYVLVALKCIGLRLHTSEFDDVIEKGYHFWKDKMFLPDGTPKYYDQQTCPIDTHCAAQGILTFLQFSEEDPQAIERAIKLARWSVEHLQDKKGYFHYQIHRIYRNRIPYMRWTQAWMQRSLTELLFRLSLSPSQKGEQ